MLLERARKLSDQLKQFQKVKAAARDAQRFGTRARQFSEAARKIGALRGDLAALKKAGIAVAFQPANGSLLSTRASDLRARVAEDPSAIDHPPFDLKYEFVDRLNAIADSGRAAAIRAWREDVGEQAGTGSQEILNVLQELPQLRAGVTQIRELRKEIIGLSETLPEDPVAARARVRELAEQMQAAWGELDASDIPEEVIAFIRQAAARGAPLTNLTSNILNWLTARSLTDSFRIRLG
ncbi:hypothetical protein [Thalassobaculum sp.]|uniref:hypothetical protein n=1 Tax=Thalassobaculum sp. TaxID=2022740 RepID=UPI003B59F578